MRNCEITNSVLARIAVEPIRLQRRLCTYPVTAVLGRLTSLLRANNFDYATGNFVLPG